MSRLSYNFNNVLPLNRKERFYTGTVFPQIVCCNNFKNISRFFGLIKYFPSHTQIKPNAENNNILLQTEYSFQESRIEEHFRNRFIVEATTKDTPDILILITEPELYLVLIEAKMFSSCTPQDLVTQMGNQEWIKNSIQNGLGIKSSNIFHIGLVPSDLMPLRESIHPYQLIYWEDIIDAYRDILKDDYFFNTLHIALQKFDVLSSGANSGSRAYVRNMETKLTGRMILDLFKTGKKFWVGRSRDLNGEKIRADIASGGWMNYNYEIKLEAESAPNGNWFYVDEFINLIFPNGIDIEIKEEIPEDIQVIDDTFSKNDEMTDWHFGHLGEEYFLDIAQNAGFGRKWDVAIYLVYIGKQGVPYSAKKQGRNVNPNWSVILKDGRDFKGGPALGGRIETGRWNRRNCNVFEWKDVKQFFERRLKVRDLS